MPIDPPAIMAGGRPVTPMRTSTRAGSTPSASAATRPMAVRRRSDVGRGDLDPCGRPAGDGWLGLRGHGPGRVERRGHARADEPPALPADAGPGSLGPSEPVGALSQAGHQVAAGERRPDSGSTSGSLRIRSSTGSIPAATASSSMAHSMPNDPGHSPRRPHPRRRGHVEGGQAVRRAAVGRGVEVPGADRGLLGELACGSTCTRPPRG